MTAIDRDELRFAAEAHLEFGGGGDELANGVLALLDALTRAEAQSETRRQQAVYWQYRAETVEESLRDQISRVTNRTERAEARIKHLESTAQALVREVLQAEKARDDHRRGKAEAEARIQAIRGIAPTIPADDDDRAWRIMTDLEAGEMFAWQDVLDILNS